MSINDPIFNKAEACIQYKKVLWTRNLIGPETESLPVPSTWQGRLVVRLESYPQVLSIFCWIFSSIEEEVETRAELKRTNRQAWLEEQRKATEESNDALKEALNELIANIFQGNRQQLPANISRLEHGDRCEYLLTLSGYQVRLIQRDAFHWQIANYNGTGGVQDFIGYYGGINKTLYYQFKADLQRQFYY